MKTNKSISVIVACYRDAGSVRECYKQLSKILSEITPNYEIIYANDASPDNAEEILREIAVDDPHLVVINHTRNFGSQNAFFSGMKVARGDAIILMDGDLQDPPYLIPDFVDKWIEDFHIVYGVRVKRKETLFRQFAYKVFYRIFRKMAQFSVPVDAGDFGLMDRKVVEVIINEFPEKTMFLRGLRAYTGFRHTGVDYVRAPRFDGVSTNSLKGNIRWAKLAIFSFSKDPLEYISSLALTCVFITVICMIVYLLLFLRSFYGGVGPPKGYMTQLLITLFLGSIQLICFSILAEYMGHIYDEVKSRPRYIVRDIIDNRDKIEKNASMKGID